MLRSLSKYAVIIGLFTVMLGFDRAPAEQIPKIIFETKQDVTGDGKLDTIKVTGEAMGHSKYYRNLLVVVTNNIGKSVSAGISHGYAPSIQFADLNGDSVIDLLITVPTGSSGGIVNGYTFTFKNLLFRDLGLPSSVPIRTQFLNHFKASISVNGKNAVVLDLNARKKELIRMGLYNKMGKLNEPAELMADPFSSINIIKYENGRAGIQGIQRLSGAYHADVAAELTSRWRWDEGSWRIVNTELKQVGP